MPAALVLGAGWGGVIGLAVAWLCAFPVVFFFFLTWTARLLALPASQLLGTLALPALASLVMFLCVEAFRQLGTGTLFGPPNSALALVSHVLVGVLVYSATVWTLHRDGVREVLALWTR